VQSVTFGVICISELSALIINTADPVSIANEYFIWLILPTTSSLRPGSICSWKQNRITDAIYLLYCHYIFADRFLIFIFEINNIFIKNVCKWGLVAIVVMKLRLLIVGFNWIPIITIDSCHQVYWQLLSVSKMPFKYLDLCPTTL